MVALLTCERSSRWGRRALAAKFLCRPASRHTHAITLSSCCCCSCCSSCTPLQFGCCCHQTSCCCCCCKDQDWHVFIMILASHFFLPLSWFVFLFGNFLSLSLSLFFSFRSLPRSVYPFSTSVLSVLLDSGIPSCLSLHIYIYISFFLKFGIIA